VTSRRLDSFWSQLALLLLCRRHPLRLLHPRGPVAPPWPSSTGCSSASSIPYRLQLRLVHPCCSSLVTSCYSASPSTSSSSSLAGRPGAPSTSSSTGPSERGMNVWRQTWCCTIALRCYIVMSNCPSICYIVAMF
jgi:hypothetical protein